MAIALVGGNPGALQSGTTGSVQGAFVTTTTAGNFLVASVNLVKNASGNANCGAISCSTSGWVQADSDTSATNTTSSVWYKENCANSEAAPTFTGASGPTMYVKLFEFSGVATSSSLNVHGSGSSTASPYTLTLPSADTYSGSLIFSSTGVYRAAAATFTTYTASYNDAGVSQYGSNNANQNHNLVSWGVTTSNTTADALTVTASTGTVTISDTTAVFKAAPTTYSEAPTGTITLASTSTEQAVYSASTTDTIYLTGSAAEALGRTDSASGIIALTGTKSELLTHSPAPTGTIILSGSKTDGATHTLAASGVIHVVGTFQESYGSVDSGTGIIHLSGTATEYSGTSNFPVIFDPSYLFGVDTAAHLSSLTSGTYVWQLVWLPGLKKWLVLDFNHT